MGEKIVKVREIWRKSGYSTRYKLYIFRNRTIICGHPKMTKMRLFFMDGGGIKQMKKECILFYLDIGKGKG